MRNDSLVKTWISVVGAVLLLIGLLGFVNNPIVGRPDALFPTGNVHNVIHILTGLIALYVGFVSTGRDQINGVIGFGILYAVIFVVPLISPNLFGLFDTNVNVFDDVLHAVVAVVSIALGYMARGQTMTAGMGR